MAREPKLPAEVKAAIEAVVEYSWAAELKDAEEQLRETGTLEGHVFAHLVTVDNWINGTTNTPGSCCEGGDDAPNPSWTLKRLLMAEVENETDDEEDEEGGGTPATLATALESLRGGYEPYVGFAADAEEAGLEAELVALIEWYGEDHQAADLLTDDDWDKHARCTMHARDPQS